MQEGRKIKWLFCNALCSLCENVYEKITERKVSVSWMRGGGNDHKREMVVGNDRVSVKEVVLNRGIFMCH